MAIFMVIYRAGEPELQGAGCFLPLGAGVKAELEPLKKNKTGAGALNSENKQTIISF